MDLAIDLQQFALDSYKAAFSWSIHIEHPPQLLQLTDCSCSKNRNFTEFDRQAWWLIAGSPAARGIFAACVEHSFSSIELANLC